MKQPCGCCSGIEMVTPQIELNRPGLPALVYRAGTYATFLETMLARLSNLYLDVTADDGSGNLQRWYPLKGLTTRALSDPSIALLDAWATVADVLTFYQERIANEGFLRTATERLSVLELARLVGYKLRPGVSASVYLAFTATAGFEGIIPEGTRAQSIPHAGESPQFFETYESLPARDAWNNLTPRLTRPQVITLASSFGTDAASRDTIYFDGISTNLKAGDVLLFVFGTEQNQQVLRTIRTVDVQSALSRTEVTLTEPIVQPKGTIADTVQAVLQPFADDATAIFADSDAAAQVATIVNDLIENVQTASNGQAAADMVSAVVPQIAQRHDVAVRRKFTRLEPWLSDLLDTLNDLIEVLPKSGTRGPSGTVQPIPSVLAASPLENLFGIIEKLAQPPSLQPANSTRLARSVREAFSPASDIAPRLLATFHPAAAKTLYQGWSGIAPATAEVEVYALRVKSAPFGNNAPLEVTYSNGTPSFSDWPIVEQVIEGPSINHEKDNIICLDSTFDKVLPGSWLVIDTSAVDNNQTKIIASPGLLFAKAGSVAPISRATYGMSAKSTQITLANPADLTTLDWLDLSQATPGSANDFIAIRNTVVYAQPELLALAEEPLDVDVEGESIELAQLYDGLESGRWIIVSGERTDIPNTTGVTGTELVMISSVIQGSRAPLCAVFPSALVPPVGAFFFSQIYYTTDPNKLGDRLVVGQLADPALMAQISAPNEPNQQYCDQVQLAQGTYVSAYVPSPAEIGGDFSPFEGLLIDPQSLQPIPGGKLSPTKGGLFAWRISSQPVHTILNLANSLAYTYDASTVTIYGNVVKATHGQTQGEVLGNGDASQALQKFPLHQSPLTYRPVPTPSGAQSTLTVRVNEVEWEEADNLFVLGPTDRQYITTTDDSGVTTVITGNGEHGLRPPTGTANVKAVYRSGTGKNGNVQAQQISQLATQPLGAKSVINPLPATGGADGDTRDQARRNIPIGTLALDRLVSVSDYADFARKFAGIGKASSQRLSNGRQLLVHLTIAGKDDIAIDPTTDLYQALQAALLQAGDPHQPLQIGLRRLRLLVISVGVKIQPEYQWETVAANLRAGLLDLYSFDSRDLGQSAFLSEAVSAMQAIPGVQYVDLRKFDSVAEDVTAQQLAGLANTLSLNSLVQAQLAHVDPTSTDPSTRIRPAELVILTPDIPDTLILTEITT